MNKAFSAMREKFERFRQHRQAFNPNGRSWYRINAKDEGKATLYIYDAIGFFGIEANQLVQEIDQLEADEITLRINSPGGDVFDGAAIYNALDRHPATIHAKIDGLAASMASLIALTGDTIEMADNAFYMIHKPWGIALGNADEMRAEADLLDKIEGTAVTAYSRKSGMDADEIARLLAAETWYSAEEAREAGFIDKISGASDDEESRSSRFDLSVFANAPEDGERREITIREAEAALRDAGMPREQAKAVVSRGFQATHQRDAGTLRAASRLSSVLSNFRQEEHSHE